VLDGDPTVPPEPWGHQIDVAGFLKDVVQLASLISAGTGFAMIWRGPDRDPDHELDRFKDIVAAHLRTDIPRLMISIAATLRAKIDDGSWTLPDSLGSVGWLSKGERVNPEQGEVLSLREACNKIIHAKKVTAQPFSSGHGQVLGSLVTIYGDRGGKLWAAEINLLAFCISVANCNFYPQGSGVCPS
jgi:hypothetical protein